MSRSRYTPEQKQQHVTQWRHSSLNVIIFASWKRPWNRRNAGVLARTAKPCLPVPNAVSLRKMPIPISPCWKPSCHACISRKTRPRPTPNVSLYRRFYPVKISGWCRRRRAARIAVMPCAFCVMKSVSGWNIAPRRLSFGVMSVRSTAVQPASEFMPKPSPPGWLKRAFRSRGCWLRWWWPNIVTTCHARADITEAGCWAAARRKFFDQYKASQSPVAKQALEGIRELYKLERKIKHRPPDKRRQWRQRYARPWLNEFRA